MNRLIKEIQIDNSITYEYPPDGGTVPIIDPYDGCSLKCPYCFQQSDENWNKDIFVKKNIVEMLKKDLKDWDRTKTIYIGSRCDPYMKIEGKYQLTRNCLKALSDLKIPTMLTTKADNDYLMRDLDVLQGFHADFALLLGLSNINQLNHATKSNKIKNITVANKLFDIGIKVWVFITPILPGITAVDEMIGAVNPHIPVFLDRVRLDKDSKSGFEMLQFIKNKYPNLYTLYTDIVETGNDVYYQELKDKYQNNDRVKFVFE